MSFLTSKSMTPLEMTFKFLLLLTISYIIYFSFIKEYGMILMMISTNIVAYMFDMDVVNNGGNYLENVKLVSNIGLQHSISNEIAYAELPLPKVIVDKIMGTITSTTIILALCMLLIRTFKVLAVVFTIVVFTHIFSISMVLTYFMFEVSPQSPILTAYLQALGVSQSMADFCYLFSGISLYYLKYFTPLFIAYYIWETEGHKFMESSKETLNVKSLIPSYIQNKSKF